MSDSLLSVEFVTGYGELLNVSSSQHPDLFYALKGAGFNYGVATSLTYKIYPATNGGQTMLAQMIFPGAANRSVWQIAGSFTGPRQPKELTIALDASYVPAIGGMVIIANFIYAGPQATGVKLIQPFLDLQPVSVNISTALWADIPFVAFYGGISKGGCTPGAYYIPYTLNTYQVNVSNLVQVFNYMNKTLAANETLQGIGIAWSQYAQYGFQLQQDNPSAWPYRDVVAFV
jgi:fumiquinazoline A oxidase